MQARSNNWKRSLLFLSLQLVILSAAVAATTHHWRGIQQAEALPAFREFPRVIRPLYDHPWVVSDEQLDRVLGKLAPRLRGPEPRMAQVDHALRFWGPDAEFDDPQAMSSAEMRELLLNHEKFAELWPHAPPFLIRTERGVEFRTKEGQSTASHTDHTLACIAEARVPLDYPIVTADGPTTARELLEFSLRDFTLNQMEYEWSALAYALYLQPVERWYATEGQEITFDRLADRLIRERFRQGVCYGNHRVHALVALLRVDDEEPILSSAGRQRIVDHLTELTALLVGSQDPSGFWDVNWPSGEPPAKAAADSEGGALDALSKRILITGHILEWLALSPKEVLPPRENITRAGQWLVQAIDGSDVPMIHQNYAFFTHAGNALTLWRGCFPAEFLKQRSAGREG